MLSLNKGFSRKISKRWLVATSSFFILLLSFVMIKSVYSAVTLSINTPPASISSELPTTKASASADTGKKIVSASYQIYSSDSYPSGSWQDCTADSGFTFGSDESVNFSCIVPSLSSGSYKMNIRAVSSDSTSKSAQTDAFIVDREAPGVSFDVLPGNPLLIKNNKPVFKGVASDALTNITSVEYKWILAATDDPVPEDFSVSGWSACSITGSGKSVNFTCDPNHIFPDSIKGEEYRMHVRAIDSTSNRSGSANYYKFQVDTTPPYNLAITFPDDAGITLYGNQSYNIDWQTPLDAFELGSGPIKIEYSGNGSFVYGHSQVISNHAASGPYSWRVPSYFDTTNGKIRITATDLAGNTFSSISANPFTIIPDSVPSVSIDGIYGNITATSPLNFTATASDSQGIASARYRVGSGNWYPCVATDGTFDETSENIVCQNVSFSEGSRAIYIEATNNLSKAGGSTYSFTYDATPPTINVGSLGTINEATSPGASAIDHNSGVSTISWQKTSGPGSISFGGGAHTVNPYISASASGDYSAELRVCDYANNCSTGTLNFTWTDNPLTFNTTSPVGGERIKGGDSILVSWTNPEGVADYRFVLSYSDNSGLSWVAIDHPNLNKSTFSYNWTTPYISSQNVMVKVEVVDTGENVILSNNSGVFTIDSQGPTVNAGEIVGTISSPVSPAASASDNFDDLSLLTYNWTSVSGPADVVFGGGINILNPSLSGTVTGLYTARLSVSDSLGNTSSDEVEFYFDGSPGDFSVLEPGSIFYQGGKESAISWTSSSRATSYELEYSLDGGLNFNTIISSITGTATSSGLYYNWLVPLENSNQALIKVSAYDEYGNSKEALSQVFYIDSLVPVVEAGNLGSKSYVPKAPGASANDGTGSGISTYTWSKVSGPGNVNFSGGANILNPNISADISGSYIIRLTVVDNLGMSAHDDVSFYYQVEPPAPIITSPGSEQFFKGLSQRNILWDIVDPGDLANFSISYSLNNGGSWIDIATVPATDRSYTWSVPEANTTEAKIRLVVSDVDGNIASAIRNFNIDSLAPVISIGAIGTSSHATSSGTSVTDNIDSEEQMNFIWNSIGVPEGGTLVFSPSSSISNPMMAGTVSGDYKAQIIAQDRAGHISSQEMTFNWDGNPAIPIVTSPDSTVFISGGNSQNIEWYIAENSDLSYFIISHSLNNGETWSEIATTSALVRSYSWDIPSGTNSAFSFGSLIKVEPVDIHGNKELGLSPNFTIDSLSPQINIGTIDSPISEPTAAQNVSASDNIESESDLTFTWSVLSRPYPEATLTISDTSATSTYFSGNMSGEYEVLLTVSDRANNVSTSSLSFIWSSLHDPVLLSPSSGDFLAGGKNASLIWELNRASDLARIEAQYSIDSGDTWLDIDNNILASSTSFIWLVPDTINSTSSMARIMTVNGANIKATSTSGIFTIDSTPPTVDAGSFVENVNSPLAPGASASDNFDSDLDLRYSWTQQVAPRRGQLSFGGGANILNPVLSGNINGEYAALLSVYDRAGNLATDTVSFARYISSGGGGGGGSSSPQCSSVVYSDWGDCYSGKQYRSIVSSTPSVCTPSDAQRSAQEQSCSINSGAIFCSTVEYGAWSDCVGGTQHREVIKRIPEACSLTSSQKSQIQRACGVVNKGPFDEDAVSVMETARKNFTGTDKNLLSRMTGQILIQVESDGRAWYVSAVDKRRYYLGSPTNAFSVMSLIGLGVKNERLDKLPVGLLEGALTQDKDSDGDGLSDRLEEALLTNRFKADSDGDGHDDRTEILNGYNPNGPGKMPLDAKVLQGSLGHIYIQVETNGEAWYVEPKTKRRYYLGRPNEAFAIMNKFGIGISNEDLNKIPVGQFSKVQLDRINKMLEDRKREIETAKK